MVRYGTVRYGMVWYGMAQYSTVWYGVVWCGMGLYDTHIRMIHIYVHVIHIYVHVHIQQLQILDRGTLSNKLPVVSFRYHAVRRLFRYFGANRVHFDIIYERHSSVIRYGKNQSRFLPAGKISI